MIENTSVISPARADWHQRALAVVGTDDDLGQAVAWACAVFEVICYENIARDFDRHPLDVLMTLEKLSRANMLRYGLAGTGDPNDVLISLSFAVEGKAVN